MSRRNDALRSVQVRTIFAPIAAAFFPHSGSAFRRPASSSKNAFVKYRTMDAPLRPRSRLARKSLGWNARVPTRRERFYGPRSLRGRAWVAKPGQRRGTQDPFPKGFPGSNPGPRMILPVNLIYLRRLCLLGEALGKDGDHQAADRVHVPAVRGGSCPVGEGGREGRDEPFPVHRGLDRGCSEGRGRRGFPVLEGSLEGERRAAGGEQAPRGREADALRPHRETRGRSPTVSN